MLLRAGVVLVALTWSPLALAQPFDPIGRDAEVVTPALPHGETLPWPAVPWSADYIRERYDVWYHPVLRISGAVTEITFPTSDWLINDFDDDTAEAIASGCERRYAGNSWAQIRCAVNAIELVLSGEDLWQYARAPCRAYSRAFLEVASRLDIPGFRADRLVIPGHILNRIYVTSHSGQVYTYAIDLGWTGAQIFPYNDNARRYHDPDGDGVIDVRKVPPIPSEGETIDYSFGPANELRGSNVARHAGTLPSAMPPVDKPAGSGGQTSGAIRAGTRR